MWTIFARAMSNEKLQKGFSATHESTVYDACARGFGGHKENRTKNYQ